MISVCMATYNGEKYIREQIDSILCQLGPNDELIISDDQSSDKTIEIITEINDERIILLHHIPAKGTSFIKATRNFENALKQAKGDYIFLSDQDDVWKSNKVSLVLKNLEKYSCIKHRYSLLSKDTTNDILWKKNRNTLIGNILYLPFHGCCMAFRKDLLDKLLPIPKGVIMHDAWIGCIGFIYKNYHVMDEELIYYRVHDNNVSRGIKNSLLFKLQYRMVLLIKLIFRYIQKKIV